MPATQSTVSALKRNLIAALKARPALAGVQVSYGDPGAQARRELIRLGPSPLSTVEPATMRPSGAKRRRQEDYTVHVIVEVLSRTTAEAAEARAVELAAELEDLLATDPTVSATPNLLWSHVDGWDLQTDEAGPEGPRAVLDISIRCVAHLI